MEVYVTNICLSAALADLKRAIATVLHGPSYEGYHTLPLNFDISLHTSIRNGPRSGRLTLPSVEVGNHFLREYGGRRPREVIRVGAQGRNLAFERSKYSPRKELVYKLARLPYVDPKQKEDLTALKAQLRTRLVSFSTVQFGWNCRDEVFSVEYEKLCSGIGRLGFDDDHRQFRLRMH